MEYIKIEIYGNLEYCLNMRGGGAWFKGCRETALAARTIPFLISMPLFARNNSEVPKKQD